MNEANRKEEAEAYRDRDPNPKDSKAQRHGGRACSRYAHQKLGADPSLGCHGPYWSPPLLRL